jgi:flagella basal body P-ring formation protein FlgA
VALDALAVQRIARRAGLDWPNAEGLRTIVVHAGLSAGGSAPAAGRGNVEVLTYARSLSAGEVVQPADLVWTKAAAAPGDAPSDADAVIGQAAKRPLRAGAVVQAHDVGAPVIVKSGDVVTVTYDADGVSLALQGKAMGAAGLGEVLAVQNTVSKKVIQAVVIGPGQAVVGPAAEHLQSSHSLRYAVR